MSRSAVIAGASGLVGSHCLRLLLAEPRRSGVTALGRRALPLEHPKLAQRVLNLDTLTALTDLPLGADFFCCLGTTMKRAGSREAFRRVDFGYVRDLARLAARHDASRFLLVSALGADPRSSVFYNRVKGEAEEAVRAAVGAAAHIFRPSLLVGERDESRPLERLGTVLLRPLAVLMVGPLRPYRPIAAAAVARAMVRVALEERPGPRVYRSDEIAALGDVRRPLSWP